MKKHRLMAALGMLLVICIVFCSCGKKERFAFQELKVAVFADVQLTDSNQDSTQNAYPSLKAQLSYAKSIGADVLVMGGDIVNNAVESYYRLFDHAFQSVYGADESNYPEFVWCMGNHEWYDKAEQHDEDAVTLFKKYARIETDALVAQSSVSYLYNQDETVANYYKVIKGIPFLSISADDFSGNLGVETKTEISQWLKNISRLSSVKAGGPIYVAYHYAIDGVTYFGQGAETSTAIIRELFKDYPTAVIFTGDTHYPCINERAINQIDFTSINIGSSSYSRMLNRSAVCPINQYYYNVQKGSDGILGEVGFLSEYTQNLQVIELGLDGVTQISRFITSQNPNQAKRVGLTWEIPLGVSKDEYRYTDERFENKAWANELYGADGLCWSDTKTLRFNVKDDKMMVVFDDVTAFNCCEHYIVTITPDGDRNRNKYYDFVSNYYKFDSQSHTNHFEISGISAAENYMVTVQAYDFFDNVSINSLSSDAIDVSAVFPDETDRIVASAYSNFSKTLNYGNVAALSDSSVRYCFKGVYNYLSGAHIVSLIDENGGIESALGETDWSNVSVKACVYNESDFEIELILKIIKSDGRAVSKSIPVAPESGWTDVSWNLLELFDIDERTDIGSMALLCGVSANVIDTENGYSLNFYLDNIDIA